MSTKTFWLTLGLSGLTLASVLAVASDHDGADKRKAGRLADVAPVSDAVYAEECGACHLAYPPGLLPARSWDRLTSDLASHFGESAELGPEALQVVRQYLMDNAADRSSYRRSVRIARSLAPGQAPLRITEVPYIARQHRELPAAAVKGNSEVGSLANCNACHAAAKAGVFDEETVSIPGIGRWED